MRWLEIPYEEADEEIDNPHAAYTDVKKSMDDLARTNRLFGGTGTVLSHLATLLKDFPSGAQVTILDIATGSADIPNAVLDWAERRGLNITVVGIDNQPLILKMAHEAKSLSQRHDLHLVQADATQLPFAPKSFDIVTCALAFHHFGFYTSTRILADMDKLARRGVIVTDLRRDRIALLGVQSALAVLRSHPFTRHDGPASVRRAFTPYEYRKMIALSGVNGIRIRAHWYYRMSLVKSTPG